MKRLWPHSLVGQLLLVVALILLLAQGINSFLLYRGAQNQNLVEASTSAVSRIAYSLDRQASDRPATRRTSMRSRRWGQLRYSAESPVADTMRRLPELEARAGQAFANMGIAFTDIRATMLDELTADMSGHVIGASRNEWRNSPINRSMGGGPERPEPRGFVIISAQQDDGQWVSIASTVRERSPLLVRTLLFQTFTIYLLMLIPLILLGRYISRPLKSLTARAQSFQPGTTEALAEQGPPDTRELIRAFNDMSDRVTRMIDEKDVMLGAIGHDLRTPLAALRVRVESVEDDTERERMITGIEDMNNMLEDILSLARLGRSTQQADPVDIRSLIETVVDEFTDLGRTVRYQRGERQIAAVRETLVRRALRNLVGNATLYGGVADISVEKAGKNLLVHVDDEGPGIPEDKIAAMFEPFLRGEGSRNRATGGSGLGLTLARAIARDHGGDIILENRDSGGLRATLKLPLG
ncbi:ATP-binding protein [Sphingorhabdus sp. SMR4y]|uniref:HAMP domain-containing sensor histidine kinase n=1 Tax=Sphingorhabdus sp. SMR4y TaxID=2584094 RepID=UPI000B5CFEE6|nr:ATP-binding protein [Sphingorhabdus sp. SMR4y]ASK87535.1 sensor protein RstB [Sphingorhabdus sp. SMR4y]